MNRLQALRTEKGINMKEAAQALSMPYTTYVNYERYSRTEFGGPNQISQVL